MHALDKYRHPAAREHDSRPEGLFLWEGSRQRLGRRPRTSDVGGPGAGVDP